MLIINLLKNIIICENFKLLSISASCKPIIPQTQRKQPQKTLPTITQVLEKPFFSYYLTKFLRKDLYSSERGAKLAKSLGLTSSRFQASHISEKVEDFITKIKRKDRTCKQNFEKTLKFLFFRYEARRMGRFEVL